MLKSITLKNFKSFGEEQTVPLQPITVLVGPNNSGKSNFLSLGRFIRNSHLSDVSEAVAAEGGMDFLLHRPIEGDECFIVCESDSGYRHLMNFQHPQLLEEIRRPDGRVISQGNKSLTLELLARRGGGVPQEAYPMYSVWDRAHDIKLSLKALQQDATVVPTPELGPDGSGLAAVLALWRGSEPERSDRLDKFLQSCMPGVRRALVKPAPQPSYQRLWIEQTDGQLFDASHLSDGVLFFTALAMHIISAEENALFLIEEPELAIHPRKLGDIVNLLRKAVEEQHCQFIIATHSPVLLNEFRNEPEAIVLFQRGEKGTKVKPLSEIPELVETLEKSDPGAMLADGFFNHPF